MMCDVMLQNQLLRCAAMGFHRQRDRAVTKAEGVVIPCEEADEETRSVEEENERTQQR